MKVLHEATVANSKAFVFLLEEYLALVKRGFADNEFAYGNGSMCTYAVDDAGSVIGACAWFIDNGKRSAWILFAAVAEPHRRHGVYSALQAEVERIARAKGVAALYLGVHVDNDAMVATSKGAGYRQSWYRAKKEL